MKTFKLIDLPEYQVLFERTYSEEDDAPVIKLTATNEFMTLVQSMGYETEEDRDSIFNEIDDEMAMTIARETGQNMMIR